MNAAFVVSISGFREPGISLVGLVGSGSSLTSISKSTIGYLLLPSVQSFSSLNGPIPDAEVPGRLRKILSMLDGVLKCWLSGPGRSIWPAASNMSEMRLILYFYLTLPSVQVCLRSVPNLWLSSGERAKLLSGPSLSRVLGSNLGSACKVANFYRLRDSSWRKTLGSNFGGDSSAFSGSSFFGDGSSATE